MEDRRKTKVELIAELKVLQDEVTTLKHEQLQTEVELRNGKKLLDGFFYAASQVNVGLSISDANLHFLKINQASADINGYSIKAHLEKSSIHSIPDITPTILPLLQGVLDSKQAVSNLEIKGIIKSSPGTIRYWLVSYFPILGETGNSVALGNVIIEITERKRLELEYEKLIALIEVSSESYQLERMKAEFVSIISHELRTPLTSMQAGLNLLQEKIIDPNSPEGETTIEIVMESVCRLVRLVNDILDLERLESGKIRLEKSACQTAELINTAIVQIQDMATQAGVRLDITTTSYSVYADRDRILQVLINLISNAIKFSPANATVWLTVELVVRGQEVKGDSPFLLFTIRDRGRGIPRHNLESIFKPFHQVDASDSRDQGGTGLGLSICSNIVEQHQGSIWAESVLGEGSTFYFTLPVKEVIHED